MSMPELLSVAMKSRVEPTTVMLKGLLPGTPGFTSATSLIPAIVPSLVHSSLPRLPSSAVK